MNKNTALLNALTILSIIETQYNEDSEILSTFANYGPNMELSLGNKHTNYMKIIKSIVKNLMDERAEMNIYHNETTEMHYIDVRWKI